LGGNKVLNKFVVAIYKKRSKKHFEIIYLFDRNDAQKLFSKKKYFLLFDVKDFSLIERLKKEKFKETRYYKL